jgi:hypothetical protein
MTDSAFKLGAGKYVDQSEFSMNRAAEQAVPAPANIFPDAIRTLTVREASPTATSTACFSISRAKSERFVRIRSKRARPKNDSNAWRISDLSCCVLNDLRACHDLWAVFGHSFGENNVWIRERSNSKK